MWNRPNTNANNIMINRSHYGEVTKERGRVVERSYEEVR
jgi:hypothetical protein